MHQAAPQSKSFWYAVATLVGSTVGVGLYAIPFAFAKASFGTGFLFLCVLSVFVLITNLLYGEVILRTPGQHQFVGYVHRYLGAVPKKINIFTFWVSVFGGLTGVMVIGSNFLALLLQPLIHFSQNMWATIFVAVLSCVILGGLRKVARFEYIVMIAVAVIMLLFFAVSLPSISLKNYIFSFNSLWFLPFGIIMFSLNGTAGIPLMRTILGDDERSLRSAIIYGTLIPASIYILFAFSVVGIAGEATTPDAISSFAMVVGSWAGVLGAGVGFLTSASIFISLSTALHRSLYEDFHMARGPSWFFILLVPLMLFFLGIRNFIDIVGLVGSVAVSIDLIFLICVYIQARKKGERIPEYTIRVPILVLYLMIVVFSLGALYALF